MDQHKAMVCRSTRRYVDLYDRDWQLRRGKSAEGLEALCVGDHVEFTELEDGACVVQHCATRKNLLKRSSEAKTKLLAANVDTLLLVTASGPICKPQTLDRVLIAAAVESIPCVLIWNKSDEREEFTQAQQLRDAYRSAGIEIIVTSALNGEGLVELRQLLSQPSLEHVVFTGVSGVGKSSLLNALIDSAEARTQHVSTRSGYGRQTTSSAFGYVYQRKGRPLMLCDLPGVQQFGLAHLEEADLRRGYPEFLSVKDHCQFANCSHLEEPVCAVREAAQRGDISTLRYRSYSQIVLEHRSLF